MVRISLAVALLGLGACQFYFGDDDGGDDDDDDIICFCHGDAGPREDGHWDPTCNPVSQTGWCSGSEKCAFVLDDPVSGAGHVGCAPDGTQGVGEACVAPELAGQSDDCAAGGSCYHGACREICTTISDQCTDATCITVADGNGNPLPVEVCLAECSPLLQDCPGAGEGCYFAGGQPVCVGAGTAQPGDACFAANACAPGLFCVGSPMGGFVCRWLCGPWPDCYDADGAVIACGCGETVACGADEVCLSIGDGMGGVADETAGMCIPAAEADCECGASPVCP